jgi:hypothetical protein
MEKLTMSDDGAPDFPKGRIIITLKPYYDSPDLYHTYPERELVSQHIETLLKKCLRRL